MHTIDCRGAPRDLGLDQGAACTQAIRSWLDERGVTRPRRWFPNLRRLTSGGVLGGGVGREVVRHYPHLAERMSGIARAAGVSLDALMEDVVASAYGVEGSPFATPAIVFAAGSDQAPFLGRALEGALPWALRRSSPEIGFASVELTLPWLAGGLVGVNEAGVGAALGTSAEAPRMKGASAAPGWLLVQECLQRFGDLEGAIEWCLKRPVSGNFIILLGDASGDRALFELAGDSCRLMQRGGDFALHGGTDEEQDVVRKRFALRPADAGVIEGSRVVVSLAERRVCVNDADGEDSIELP